jgi:hypothetical protein
MFQVFFHYPTSPTSFTGNHFFGNGLKVSSLRDYLYFSVDFYPCFVPTGQKAGLMSVVPLKNILNFVYYRAKYGPVRDLIWVANIKILNQSRRDETHGGFIEWITTLFLE